MCSSFKAGGSAIFCDIGVIVWKWPCVLPLVTCSSVMVTSHCWPFLYNYPCYLSNWHYLSLALTIEVLNICCAWWWTHILTLWFLIVLLKLKECLFFSLLWFLGVLSIELNDQILEMCLCWHVAFPSFFPLILCTNEITKVFWHLDFPLSSLTTNANPKSGVIFTYSWSGKIVNAPHWFCCSDC